MAACAAEAGPSHRTPPGSKLRETGLGQQEMYSGEEGVDAESGSASDTGSGSENEHEHEHENGFAEREYRAALPSRHSVKGKVPSAVPTKRPLAPNTKTKKGGSWTDLDLSIIVALVSPIGNWLTGGDHIKNLFLIILLIFYLHQIIEVPWQLYLSARPRKTGRRLPVDQDPEDERIARFTSLAERELRWHEILYLGLAILSPFIGAIFLRHVLAALGDHDTLSWFSTTLFVLATGIRPWSHFISRLNDRARELHTVLHYPDEDSLVHLYEQTDDKLYAALKRVDALERELRELREGVRRHEKLREVCDDLTEILGDVERAAKRSERKADAARAAQHVRLTALETQFEEQRKRDATGLRSPPVITSLHSPSKMRAFVDKLLSLPRALLLFGLGDSYGADEHRSFHISLPSNGLTNGNGTLHSRIRSPDREKHLPHLVPRLATIPEAEDSDSEETFVGDKDGPTTPGGGSPRKTLKSRSATHAMFGRPHKGPTLGQTAFDYVEDVMLWPYRFSVRVIIAMLPPMQKIMPRV